MFYDKFRELCAQRKISVSRAAVEIGLSNSTPTKWKKTGASPDSTTLYKIADYFGVPVSDLMDTPTLISTAIDLAFESMHYEKKEKATIDVIDDDLREYLDELRNRPEQRLLFSVTKNATKAQIEAIVKMIEEMKGS